MWLDVFGRDAVQRRKSATGYYRKFIPNFAKSSIWRRKANKLKLYGNQPRHQHFSRWIDYLRRPCYWGYRTFQGLVSRTLTHLTHECARPCFRAFLWHMLKCIYMFFAVQMYEKYLDGVPCNIKTIDHYNIQKYKTNSARIIRWSLFWVSYNFRIEDVNGSYAADYLSITWTWYIKTNIIQI